MHSALLKEMDGTVIVEVPAAMLEALHLHAGESVNLRVEPGMLTLSADTGESPTLEEMLATCDFSLPISAEEIEWDQAPPTGRELI